jgi:transcriptional regulator with PAS, ATPase and Fis domain
VRLARFIHDESARTAGTFLAIKSAAVPETLLESELFGHARGSFTAVMCFDSPVVSDEYWTHSKL